MEKSKFKGLNAWLLAILLLSLYSCEKHVGDAVAPGKVSFTLVMDQMPSELKSSFMDTTVNSRLQLLVSVMNEDSMIVLDKEPVALYKFSDQFVSDKIELMQGVYFLTEFMVVNSSGEVVYATPRHGSELAKLVRKPLPIYFKIAPGIQNNMNVEVVPVGNHTPGDFGYVSFGLQIIYPLKFYAAVYNNNPLLMAPSALIPAYVTILGPDGWNYEFKFERQINALIVRAVEGEYTFLVRADSMQLKFVYSLDQLKKATRDNPLMIPFGNQNELKEMLIRTSPATTSDALITDLNSSENFGDHRLFAGTFRSEPILTVMRTTRSMMHVDIRREMPKSATIKKVELILHILGEIYPEPADTLIRKIAIMPQAVLQQITEPWDEYKVTWNNQPATTMANQVYIDYQPWLSSNRRVYDITPLVIPVDKVNLPNYGFMLMNFPEQLPGGVEFASSDAPVPEMRPIFKVYYTLP